MKTKDSPPHTAVALISGGLGDIGRAIARALSAEGVAVSIGDVRPVAEARSFVAELRSGGFRADYHRVDVTDERAVAGWVTAVARRWGPPTIVVPNAAVFAQGSVLKLTSVQWRRDLQVNLDGAFYLAISSARLMVQHKVKGAIVFIGSWAAHVPHPHVPAYSVSKAGLRMLMQCLAAETAPYGIRVNEVAPGFVDAGLSAQLFRQQPRLAADCRTRVPIQRLISTGEIARHVVALARDNNLNQTGSTVVVDGGLSLGPLAHYPRKKR